MLEELDLQFRFSNPIAHREQTSPVFLRHRGIQGSLITKNRSGHGVEKVKVVLRGRPIKQSQETREHQVLTTLD